MSSLGTYADRPLPEEWLPVLRRLRPCSFQLKRPKAPSPAKLIGVALEPLDEREQYVVFARFGHGKTLEQIGESFDITRERVRQIEKKALKKIGSFAPGFFDVLNTFLEQIGRSGFIVADLDDGRSQRFVNATPAELWLCCLKIYVKVTSKPVATAPIKIGSWITYHPRRVKTRSLKLYLEEKCRFIALEQAARHLDIEAYDLAHGWSFFEDIYLTAGGLLGSCSWSILSFMEAAAWELAQEGFTEWHFSQMAKALKFVYPERFSQIINRNVAAALSRPDSTAFQLTGQKGRWQLKELGDGYKSNREATIAVLRKSGIALHYTSIHKRLKRSVRLGTVCALLERDNAFKGYGDGIYGLANQDRSCKGSFNDSNESSESDLLNFLSGILASSRHPLEKAMNEEGPLHEARPKTYEGLTKEGTLHGSAPENLRERILNVLQVAERPLRSREIAQRLGQDRKIVSQYLHYDLKLNGVVTQDSQHGWFLTSNHQRSL